MSDKTCSSALLGLVNGEDRGLFQRYEGVSFSEPVLSLKANKELQQFLKYQCRHELIDIPFKEYKVSINNREIRWSDKSGSCFVYRPDRFRTSPFIARNLSEIVRIVLNAGKTLDQTNLISLQRLFKEVSSLYAPFIREWGKPSSSISVEVDVESLDSLNSYCETILQSISSWMEYYKEYFQYSWSSKDEISFPNGLKLSEYGLEYQGTLFRDLLSDDYLINTDGMEPVKDVRADALKAFISSRKHFIERLSFTNVRNVLIMMDNLSDSLELSDPSNSNLVAGLKSAIHTMISHP